MYLTIAAAMKIRTIIPATFRVVILESGQIHLMKSLINHDTKIKRRIAKINKTIPIAIMDATRVPKKPSTFLRPGTLGTVCGNMPVKLGGTYAVELISNYIYTLKFICKFTRIASLAKSY
jgi:hypothetical protein